MGHGTVMMEGVYQVGLSERASGHGGASDRGGTRAEKQDKNKDSSKASHDIEKPAMAAVGKIRQVIREIGEVVTHPCLYVLDKMVVDGQEETAPLILGFGYSQSSGFNDNIPFSNDVKVCPDYPQDGMAVEPVAFNLAGAQLAVAIPDLAAEREPLPEIVDGIHR